MHEFIWDWNQKWDPDLMTSTVGPVWPPKVDWYSPCMIWGRGGDIGRSVGGMQIWGVGWVYGRGFCGQDFGKVCYWGISMIFSGIGEWVWTWVIRWISLGNFEWTRTGWFGRIFGQKIGWWGDRVIIWIFGQAVRKRMLLGQADGYKVNEYEGRGPSRLSRWRAYQRFCNQGWCCVRTDLPMMKDGICCWIYTINPSVHHCPTVMRVRWGNLDICMDTAPPEWRECVPMSFDAKPSLSVPTLDASVWMIIMKSESLL